MYFLDANQTHDLIRQLGFDRSEVEAATRPGYDRSSEVHNVRSEYVNAYVAAKEALAYVRPFTSVLLYIHSVGGRLDVENAHLFERLRLSMGEARPNYLAPGCVFQGHDEANAVTFCEMAANYGFRAALLQHSNRPWVAFTEDDEMRFIAGS